MFATIRFVRPGNLCTFGTSADLDKLSPTPFLAEPVEIGQARRCLAELVRDYAVQGEGAAQARQHFELADLIEAGRKDRVWFGTGPESRLFYLAPAQAPTAPAIDWDDVGQLLKRRFPADVAEEMLDLAQSDPATVTLGA